MLRTERGRGSHVAHWEGVAVVGDVNGGVAAVVGDTGREGRRLGFVELGIKPITRIADCHGSL